MISSHGGGGHTTLEETDIGLTLDTHNQF